MTRRTRPDHDRLYEMASQRAGYFTAEQARSCGFSGQLIGWHVRAGRFTRVRRGLYRLKRYPASHEDHVVEAWLAAGTDAVVSHESALSLHTLSDVVPSRVHLIVPRSHRWLAGRVPSGVTIHTITEPLPPAAIITHGAVRVTSPARSIVDAAESGTAPEQILLAVRQALERGLTTPRELRAGAASRSARVQRLIHRGIQEGPSA